MTSFVKRGAPVGRPSLLLFQMTVEPVYEVAVPEEAVLGTEHPVGLVGEVEVAGVEGYFWMPYDYITKTKNCSDFWTIRMVE
ncbi:MAG: hypothetical protein J6X88_04835 [Bacteroidales bacterium]|nr:hypothetical protein [Bacteroidales bacterium]